MPTPGVVVDTWKIPVFQRNLSAAGFKFTTGKGPTKGTTLITVECDNVVRLYEVVEEANNQCKEVKDARSRLGKSV